MTSTGLDGFLVGLIRAHLEQRGRRVFTSLTPVSVNTQSRRLDVVLGYLRAIRELGTEKLIRKRFEETPSESNTNVAAQSYGSGRATNSPSFAKHYISYLLSYRLILKQGQVLVPTGIGRLLRECGTNPSCKSPESQIVATRRLAAYIQFEADPLTTSICISELSMDKQKISKLAEKFSGCALATLDGVSERNDRAGAKESIRAARQKIVSWTNPKTYSEHLVSSKLHMLADCGVVDRLPSGFFSLVRSTETLNPVDLICDQISSLGVLAALSERVVEKPALLEHLIWLQSVYSSRPQSIVPMSIVAASAFAFGIDDFEKSLQSERVNLSYDSDFVSLRGHLGETRGQSYLSILQK